MSKQFLKSSVTVLIIFICAVTGTGLFALGGGGGDTAGIPLPVKDFRGTIVDSQSISTDANKISWGGKIFIEVKRGNYAVTIPFEKIESIAVEQNSIREEGFVAVEIVTNDGTIEAQTDGTKKLFGETAYGTFQILLKDIQSITFKH